MTAAVAFYAHVYFSFWGRFFDGVLARRWRLGGFSVQYTELYSTWLCFPVSHPLETDVRLVPESTCEGSVFYGLKTR